MEHVYSVCYSDMPIIIHRGKQGQKLYGIERKNLKPLRTHHINCIAAYFIQLKIYSRIPPIHAHLSFSHKPWHMRTRLSSSFLTALLGCGGRQGTLEVYRKRSQTLSPFSKHFTVSIACGVNRLFQWSHGC
jgi:hypothetical protein